MLLREHVNFTVAVTELACFFCMLINFMSFFCLQVSWVLSALALIKPCINWYNGHYLYLSQKSIFMPLLTIK